MNEIYSKVFIARFKRRSARPAGCPVAFWIEGTDGPAPMDQRMMDQRMMDQRMMPQRRAGAPAPRARRARTARGIRARACVPESIESGILDLLGDIRIRLLV